MIGQCDLCPTRSNERLLDHIVAHVTDGVLDAMHIWISRDRQTWLIGPPKAGKCYEIEFTATSKEEEEEVLAFLQRLNSFEQPPADVVEAAKALFR